MPGFSRRSSIMPVLSLVVIFFLLYYVDEGVIDGVPEGVLDGVADGDGVEDGVRLGVADAEGVRLGVRLADDSGASGISDDEKVRAIESPIGGVAGISSTST